MPDTFITPVVFRKFCDGDIIALLPDETNDKTHMVNSYMRIGQHGEADYTGIIRKTVPAKPSEYAALKKEMEKLGYVFKVCKKYAIRFRQYRVG
jgi:hypothetical protein